MSIEHTCIRSDGVQLAGFYCDFCGKAVRGFWFPVEEAAQRVHQIPHRLFGMDCCFDCAEELKRCGVEQIRPEVLSPV